MQTSTTRWKDTTSLTLNDAISLLIDAVENDTNDTSVCLANWNVNVVLSNTKHIRLNENDIEYNIIRFSYDQIMSGTLPIEDRTSRKNGFVIVYHNGVSINYIINQNSSAKKVLRKMLSYTGRSELEKNVYEFDSDFLIWLLYKVYSGNNIISIDGGTLSEIRIESIKGFRGDTGDLQTKVAASGESVMKIISTLSFLLESRKINQIKLELSCDGHEKINVILQTGSIAIDDKLYQGCFEDDLLEERNAKLYLLLYNELLPLLIQEYTSDKENNSWSKATYIDFVNDVGKVICDRIDGIIGSLSDERKLEMAVNE